MTSLLEAIMEGESGVGKDSQFPYAPHGWTRKGALKAAHAEDVDLNEDHWEAVRALQEYYARHQDGNFNLRELHDALGERFHAQGGMKYLYELFPVGPVAQGFRIAGLKAPAGSVDKSFGSVA